MWADGRHDVKSIPNPTTGKSNHNSCRDLRAKLYNCTDYYQRDPTKPSRLFLCVRRWKDTCDMGGASFECFAPSPPKLPLPPAAPSPLATPVAAAAVAAAVRTAAAAVAAAARGDRHDRVHGGGRSATTTPRQRRRLRRRSPRRRA